MTVTGPDGTQWPANSLRGIEHASIRAFVQKAADLGYLSGRVLDYGCGKQPYRDIVEAAGGHYIGYDDPKLPASVADRYIGDWSETENLDGVLCTQVLQYIPFEIDTDTGLRGTLDDFNWWLEKAHGHLILTYPTNWPEVEPEDLHRFTKAGMERLLKEAGFEIVLHEERAQIIGAQPNVSMSEAWFEKFALGYGCIARA
jgi:hypothetical protein